ncbi:MAG: hypothetical protein HC836_44850 [Richelia sp. RM2_1_2]|nr:hypothetical protein [Richelia sp. RM2_1_2]
MEERKLLVDLNGYTIMNNTKTYIISDGRQLLIEEDAGGFDLSLNPKLVNESTQRLHIETSKPVLINCILQKWGVKNKNGRIYPKDVLVKEVQNYIDNCINQNGGWGEADHPDSSVVSIKNIPHIIRKAWWGTGDKQNILYGELEIITSPGYMENGIVSMVGDGICELLKRGGRLGISSRGVGTLKKVGNENIVQNDFELICFDLVASPSTPGAYLFPSDLLGKNKSENKFFTVGENTTITGQPLNEQHDEVLKVLNRFLI